METISVLQMEQHAVQIVSFMPLQVNIVVNKGVLAQMERLAWIVLQLEAHQEMEGRLKSIHRQ